MKLLLAALVAFALGCSLAACGGTEDEKPEAGTTPTPTTGGTVLELTEGSTLTVAAPGATGVVSDSTPVSLEFEALTCAETLPGFGFRRSKVVDLVAGTGNQLCLVETAVTNAGKKPNFFSSREISRLRTADGSTYPITEKTINYQAIADSRSTRLASTSDLITAGATKYDYAIYEVPAAAEPEAVVYRVVTVP